MLASSPARPRCQASSAGLDSWRNPSLLVRVGFQATDQEPATLQRGLVPRNLPELLDNAGEDEVLDVRAFYENNPAWAPLTG